MKSSRGGEGAGRPGRRLSRRGARRMTSGERRQVPPPTLTLRF